MITPLIIIAMLLVPLLAESITARIQHRCIRLEVALLTGLTIAFVFFALGHFIKTEGMMDMLPPLVPYKSSIIYLTGVWELLIAAGLTFKAYRKAALLSAITTLILFFPVNIYAALNYTGLGGHQWGPIYLIIRGPLQLILIGWCVWAYRQNN